MPRSRRPSRTAAGALLVVVGLLLTGCDVIAEAATPATPGAPAPTSTTTTTAGPAPASSAGSALAALASIPVKGRAPLTGYVRTARFGAAWLDVDRNGCDTRDDVLRRDLTGVAGSRCTVRSGELHDPYTGRTIAFVRGQGTSEAVQIDHVVALADAWRSGAQQLTQERRVALANDPVNLFAVDGPTNSSKGDGDAATWLPPRKAFRCTYVAHQVAVKHAYGLWVTPAEHDAIERVLASCPDEPLPAGAASGAGAGASSGGPQTTAPTTSAPSRSTAPVVHPGAFCSPEGATGRTEAGTGMACSPGSDGRDRWRSAG